MTLEAIYYISQIVAVFAVIASLVFVGLQVRDSSRAVRAATAQAVHDNYAGWYTALLGNEKRRNANHDPGRSLRRGPQSKFASSTERSGNVAVTWSSPPIAAIRSRSVLIRMSLRLVSFETAGC